MLRIDLTEAQRVELKNMRDRAEPAYLRERASAILRISEGHSAASVAGSMLLRRRRPEYVREWARRYLNEGVSGLYILPRGGGRPPGSKDRKPRTKRTARTGDKESDPL